MAILNYFHTENDNLFVIFVVFLGLPLHCQRCSSASTGGFIAGLGTWGVAAWVLWWSSWFGVDSHVGRESASCSVQARSIAGLSKTWGDHFLEQFRSFSDALVVMAGVKTTVHYHPKNAQSTPGSDDDSPDLGSFRWCFILTHTVATQRVLFSKEKDDYPRWTHIFQGVEKHSSDHFSVIPGTNRSGFRNGVVWKWPLGVKRYPQFWVMSRYCLRRLRGARAARVSVASGKLSLVWYSLRRIWVALAWWFSHAEHKKTL